MCILMEQEKTLDPACGPILELFCATYANYRRACEVVGKEGLTVQGHRGMVKHPALDEHPPLGILRAMEP